MNSKLATIPAVTPEPSVEEKGKGRRLVSLPFMILRAVSTAGVTLAALIQIFVFARTMTPEQFSIFILVGAFGYALWIVDFGIVKYLFVRLRAAHLNSNPEPMLVKQATLVVLFYTALVLIGAVLCFALLEALQAISPLNAFQYTLFFIFTALNLVWYALRNISFAVDDYIYFEWIEAVRRFASIGFMLAMLVDLPLLAFLLAVAAEPLFKLLLGPAATMPSAAVWVIIALLFGNLLQTVSSSLLIHTGFFQASARVMLLTAICATVVGAVSLLTAHTIVHFMAVYAGVYIAGALLHTVLAIRGPVRATRAG